MNPERWAEIAGSFTLEREENETGSARRCVSHTRSSSKNHYFIEPLELESCDKKDNLSYSIQQHHHENLKKALNKVPRCPEDYNHIISVLKDVVKEKVEESKTQKDEISFLRVEIEKLKSERKARDACTQTNYLERENRKKPAVGRSDDIKRTENGSCSTAAVANSDTTTATVKLSRKTRNGDVKCENDCDSDDDEDGVSKPLSKIILRKIDVIEKRMDFFLSFIQNHFPKSSYAKFHFNKLRKDESPVAPITINGNDNSSSKPWNKPPAFQPRPTCCSSLREAYSRNTTKGNINNDKVCARGRYDSVRRDVLAADHKFGEINEGNRDIHPDLEQRLQLLEFLVTQLKQKFMKLILIQKQNMIVMRTKRK